MATSASNKFSQEEVREKVAGAAEKRRNKADTAKGKEGDDKKAASAVEADVKNKSPNVSDSPCSATLENDEMSPPLFDSEPEEEEDLFEDGSKGMSQEMMAMADEVEKDDASPFKGTPLSELNATPKCSAPLPALAPTKTHAVLFKVPLVKDTIPEPQPVVYRDIWNSDYVKMPCSHENLYPVEGKNGKKELKNRWELIENALKGNIISSFDLEEAILSYNTRYSQKWDFRGLHAFFTEELEREESQMFFTQVMPKMIDLALQLPEICTQAIPLLKKSELRSITLSQKQIASLIANAFFCTFPRRNARQKQSEYSSYPDINFNALFMGSKGGLHPRKCEKLKCLIHYFRRVTHSMPTGTVTFQRQMLKSFPRWDQSQSRLTRIHVSAQGTIEDDGLGMLQVDFANKFLGGGVLGYGCVQEEIRFLVCPEMILSRLFTEVLDNNECLIMTGCERYSNYTGYGDKFRWAGNHLDKTPRDTWGRRCTEVVAIDALVIHGYSEQFQANLVRREVNKAYVGFLTPGVAPKHLSAVATGNWGCGAFGGDLRLKALIQLMAAAEAKRDVAYFTFGDIKLRNDLHLMNKFITDKELSISDLWALIQQYNQNKCRTSKKPDQNLFAYIYDVYHGYDNDTDEETSASPVSGTKNSPNYVADTP